MPRHAYLHLFKEANLGTLRARNRIVMPPMGTNYSNDAGEVTDRLVAYYKERAAGGAGTIIVEVAAVHPGGRAIPRQIAIWDDKYIKGLSRLAAAIKGEGALAFIQLHHAGRQTSTDITGEKPVSASALQCPVMQETPRQLEIGEIRQIVSLFGDAARRAKQAGFDGIELHGAHGYLISQFLSPYSNHRQDEYGGSLENRMRFALEVINAARENTSPDYALIYRISADEYMEGGLTLSDTKQIVPRLVSAGVDAIHVSAGVHGSPAPMIPLIGTPEAPLVHLAHGLKEVTDVPVIAVAKIHNPELADRVLAEGKADFIAMGRALITDPDLPNKIAEGRNGEVRACITCNQACIDKLLAERANVTCIYNARAGRELEFPMVSASQKKRVLVIGGGPAGMEAARVAAIRGHEVDLYEQSEELGGQSLLASATPHKGEFGEVTRYLKHEVERLAVKVYLGHEADVGTVHEVQPDVVIVATGALPLIPDVPGADAEHVAQAWDVIREGNLPGSKIAIIGGGLVGLETAELLAEKDKQVTVIERLPDVATDIGMSLRAKLLERLMNNPRVKIITNALVERIDERAVIINNLGTREEIRDLDSIVLAVGAEPNNDLAREIEATGADTIVIGDAEKPRKALDAIHQAFRTAYTL